MTCNKIFFSLIIFLVLISNVNAIVVSDISEQIETGNQTIMENNVKISAEISQMKEQINRMEQSALKREDIPELVYNIEVVLNLFLQRILIMLLVLILFISAGIFYATSKGWL